MVKSKGIIPCITALAVLAAILALGSVCAAQVAQKYTAPNASTIGSGNEATADQTIPRPFSRPCVVQLFSDYLFENFNAQSFSYAPPADCPGPWAKVVLEGDFAVTAGVQYDRTANVWLGATNIYFGTTPEPSSTLGPTWHFESDLTEYSSVFAAPQTGTVDLGNLVNSTYTGIISGSMQVQFYPLGWGFPEPVADMVLPLSAGSTGGTVALSVPTDTLSATFTLPTNIERAYLDVLAQSQSGDEFWYSCAPNDVAGELDNCGNTGFRETEVTIDGQPAGVAPIYPWIYTGGIDPFLWSPSPGVQTLNFAPYRVDLTPFAGVLSNGQPHEVSLSVYNADDYFSATANLLLYLDHFSKQVTGAVTENTIGAGPNPVVTEHLHSGANGIKGTVTVTSNRQFKLAGYAVTSHGRVNTEIVESIEFSNSQYYKDTDTQFEQNIDQLTTISSVETVTNGPFVTTSNTSFSWPLTLDINYVVAADGSSAQTTTAKQTYEQQSTQTVNGFTTSSSQLSDSGKHTDVLNFDSSGNFTGNTNQTGKQDYKFNQFPFSCFHRKIDSVAGLLTSAKQSTNCGFGSMMSEDEPFQAKF